MTALRYPFSLFSETKRAVGDCTVQRTGDVADTMDKGIGRPVIKIKGVPNLGQIIWANYFLKSSCRKESINFLKSSCRNIGNHAGIFRNTTRRFQATMDRD